MFQRILIAYDGSVEGKRMLVASGELTAFTKAEAHLLAVASLPSANLYMTEGLPPEQLMDDEKKIAQEILDEGVAQFRERGFAVVGHLAVGDPVEEICRLAKELNCDLIVVGHVHRSTLGRWWQASVGRASVSKSLLDAAPCAVFVARTVVDDE